MLCDDFSKLSPQIKSSNSQPRSVKKLDFTSKSSYKDSIYMDNFVLVIKYSISTVFYSYLKIVTLYGLKVLPLK